MDDIPDRSWTRWALAGGAALVTIVVLAFVIGSLVPQRRQGVVIGGVGMEELRTACTLTSRTDRDLCQRVFRVDAAVDDGQCTAAQVQARPILALEEGESPLRDRLRAYTLARLEPCQKPEAPGAASSADAGVDASGE